VLVTGGATMSKSLCIALPHHNFAPYEVPTPTATADLVR